MINTSFEAMKIKREIKRSGKLYEIKRAKQNEFNEPTSDLDTIGSISGLYHEQSSSVKITTGDTTQVRSKKVPAILCLYEEATSLNLKSGDTIFINQKPFKITGIINIQEWNMIVDISLEVVDNGI